VYTNPFWERVVEVGTISEPLVKVLCLVDGDKPTMGYLYEAKDRSKEAIQSDYASKGSLRYEKYITICDLIDEKWNRMLHHPIHAATLVLNPVFSYS
jgi:hypothetical protein